MSQNFSRRDFLRVTSASGVGLMIGVALPYKEQLIAAGMAESSFEPNVWIKISPDNKVVITLAKSEMGQGVKTSLPMIVAEELDVDLQKLNIVQADAHTINYGSMMTVGSRSVRGGAWLRLREAGATAREMLVSAAAKRWGVSSKTCRTEDGSVFHDPSNRSFTYGALTVDAATLKIPKTPRLKEPSQFRYIGKYTELIDTPEKVSGKTIFGMDVRLPNMLYATVVHPPVFGASVKSYNDREARKVPGVKKVFQVSLGLAVVAKNTWSAFKGAKALEIEWDNGDFNLDSNDISKRFKDLAAKKGVVARKDGDVEKAMKKAKKHMNAIYEVPYLAHATMEPMNCTAHVLDNYCELWAPTQNPQGAQRTAIQLTGFSKDKVKVHVTQLGCGLGRRSRSDFIRDAVEIAMNVDAPVKLIWTREEDMQHDYYRPSTFNIFESGLDEDGEPLAWKHRVVASPLRGGGANNVDRAAVDGASTLPYDIPNIYVDYCRPDIAVPVGYWRSVGPSQNTFITESFIDELAHAAGKDPYEYRKKLLKNQPRLLNVLNLAAKKSGWFETSPKGHTKGIAVVEDKGSTCAQVAEISLENNQLKVHRIVCALDCGQVIHPGIVESQTVGSVVFGLTAALYGEISIKKGRVVQSNFHDYPLLGIHEMPDVEVYLVDSNDEPGGAGEPAVPPVAPAVTNAIFAATGKRIRSLPIKLFETQ